jgi:CRISPR type I-E-associated protein CasB/Cse2
MSEDQSTTSENTIDRKIGAIAHLLSRPGAQKERAFLRRAQEGVEPSVFWEILETHVGSNLGESVEKRWKAILVCLADAISKDAHSPKRNFGTACRDSGLSEGRFVQLLESGINDLPYLARRACQLVISRGESFNVADVARLILSCGGPNHETVRRSLSRKFFSQKKPTPPPQEETRGDDDEQHS